MNTVSNTAYYCCGIRMLDSEHTQPICNDSYASLFMDEKGMEIFEPFRSETMPNISNATRCRIIDDHLRNEIAQNPDTIIISIGAGFDSRPFRLNGGEWIEVDEPAVINIKEQKLPANDCPNPLKRICIEFDKESLDEKLTDIDETRPIVFVIEGVFMYLEASAIDITIKQIKSLFPEHMLYCDLMSKAFFEKFAQRVHQKLVAAGGTFTQRPVDPTTQFIQQGYELKSRLSMTQHANETGTFWHRLKMPKPVGWLLLNVFLKDLQGYAVHQFRSEGTG